jgi:osmotically-inducible protein OsmY
MRHLGLIVALAAAAIAFNGCSTAKKSGATVRDATVAAGQEVGDKAEDVGEQTAAAGKKVAEKADDATTTSAIKMRFAKDEKVQAFKIDVDTKDGVVTLNGTVSSKAEADRAVELARGVEGVKTVKSNLTVKSTTAP